MKYCVFLAFCVFFVHVNGHSYHLGDCPNIDPMPQFEMKRLLGIWYVIQKTGTASSCIVYNFTRTDEPGVYELEQVSQHFAIAQTPYRHAYHYTGKLTVPDSGVPARMRVRFPLSVAGSASYTVFATDYDNYAGIFTCQGLGFSHRQSATILSRARDLDKIYVDKLRSKLSQAQIDPFDLSLISQNDCPKNLTAVTNIDIDDETFSAHNIGQVIKKAGEKIGEGVEYVAKGASKLYHKIADSGTSEHTTKKYNELVNSSDIDSDSEWLP